MDLKALLTIWQGLPSWAPFAVVSVLVLLLVIVIAWAMWRARVRKRVGGKVNLVNASLDLAQGVGQWMENARRALRYLNTRREWRYQVPWVVMLGERQAGKSSIVASLTTGQRQELLLREQRLALRGTGWSFFDNGVAIDVDGRLSAAAGEEGARDWSSVLRQLNYHRPERPVDSVVLAVSARTLLSGDADATRQVAEQCYRQLWELQKAFEFALPVYLVVTQCDAVPGYQAFWSLQPAERRRQVMGWSNPFGVAHAFEADWVDLAMDEMQESLQTLLLQAAARPEPIPDFDDFFLFPQHFAALRAPLRAVLAYVFRAGAYHDDFSLRGVYFSGSLGQAITADERLARDDVDFVDALFDTRIFRERGLARPTRQGLLSRNRLIRRLQLSAAVLVSVLFIALGAAGVRLNQQVDAAISALDLLQAPQSKDDGKCVSMKVVYKLLDEISHIDVNLVYPSIPASWFDHRVTHHTAVYVSDAAFEQVVFPSLACHLQKRGQTLLAGMQLPSTGNTGPAQAVHARRDALVDYTQAVSDFERNMQRFNQISVHTESSGAKSLMAVFASLAEYVYGHPLPANIRYGEGQHVQALAKVSNQVRPQLPADYRQLLANNLQTAMAGARSDLDVQLGRGTALLHQLDSSDAMVDGRLLYEWLSWVNADWLGKGVDGATSCGAYVSQLNPVLKSLVSQYSYPQHLLTDLDAFSPAACERPGLQQLSALRVAPYGPLFVRQGESYRMIPALVPEMAALQQLADVPYMQVPVDQGFRCRLALSGWQAEGLAEAVKMVRQYQGFMHAHQPANNSKDGMPLYEQVARRKLLGVLDQQLDRSQRSQRLSDTTQPLWLNPLSATEETLAVRSQAFSRALGSLLFLVNAYGELDFQANRARFLSCARGFAGQNLGRINDLADASGLYVPSPNPSLAVESGLKPYFDLGGAAQAQDYLKRQLDRSQVLVGYAGPFVDFLRNTDSVTDAQAANSASASYWEKTIGEINSYIQYKKPVGQVVDIQQFIEKVLVPLAPENCGQMLADYKAAPLGNDLFSHKRAALQQRADWYCHDHARAVVWDQYDSFATRFNQTLAGHFPFGPLNSKDASLAQVAGFLRDYQAERKMLADNLAQLPEQQGQGMRGFVQQLDEVTDFFGLNLAAQPGAAQQMTLKVAFRYRPNQGSGGANVVRWRLRVGKDQASYPNGPTSLDWKPGDALRLEVDWADLSGLKPKADTSQSDLQVSGQTARFEADGSWALLRFIDRHRSTSGALVDPTEPDRIVLAFQVPLAVGPGVKSPAPTSAQIYLTLSLSGKDPKTGKPVTLIYPSKRPHSAPTIWGDSDNE
jgi:type VI secretion system protein ImpL